MSATRDLPGRRRVMQQAGALAGFGLVGTQAAFLSNIGDAIAQPAAGPPRSGGMLTFHLSSDPPNFDPLSNTSGTVIGVCGPCYNGLVMADPLRPDRIVGDLAASWDISADGLVYTFALLKGVKFHDGKPFTSADVKFTYDLIRNPPAGTVSLRRSNLAGIESIETPDDHTVRIRLKEPSSAFLSLLAGGWLLILPKHVLEAKGSMKDQIVGTGPFKFKEYVRGVSVELVRNPDYHVKGRPYLDGIKAFVIPSPGTVMAYFRTGQLNAYQFMASDSALQAQKEFGERVYIQSVPSTSFVSVAFNPKVKPWDDIRVRQAAAMAIDRRAALKTLFQDAGAIGGMTLPGEWSLPTAEFAKIPGYDSETANIAGAKKLLAEAGYPNGFSTVMLVRRIARFEPLGVFIKDQLSKVGIDAQLDLQESAAYQSKFQKHEFQIDAGGGNYQSLDPSEAFAEVATCGGIRNLFPTCDGSLDQLFARQAIAADPAERKALVNQLEAKVLANYGTYYMFFTDRFMGLSNKVRDWALHPNTDNNVRMQDVWISA